MLRNLHIAAITLVLLFFLCVPLAFIIAYGFSALLGGLLLLTPLIALQVLALKALQRRLASPAAITASNAEELNHETEEKPLLNANKR